MKERLPALSVLRGSVTLWLIESSRSRTYPSAMKLLASSIVLALACASCANSAAQKTPPLQATPAADAAPKKDFFQEVSDTTARIVQEPARMFTPAKKPPAAEPVTYDPPAAVMTQRRWDTDNGN
jgi:hypothetical protein